MSNAILVRKENSQEFIHPVADSNGNLKCELTSSIDVAIGDVEMKGTENVDGSGAKRHVVVDASGNQSVNVLGNEVGDGSGAVRHLHLDANGNLHSSVVNTVNVNPANVANSLVTDAPTSALTTALTGRTTIGTANTTTHLLCDAAGHLQVDVPSTVGIKIEDISSTLDADHANNSRSIVTTMKGRTNISDHTTGTYLLTDANGHLAVEDKMLTVVAPTVSLADTTQLQRVNLSLHDVGNSTTRTAKCDANGRLIVTADAITAGDDATVTTAQQNLVYGRAGAASLKALAVDSDGHLQVDILSGGGGGGDASAANQSTMITHLSEIEGAVETLEGCVSGNKVAVELSAGTINIGDVDVVSASGNTQLPSTLGQKANSNSLSICRSNTVGAFDLSGRTTIGTASTSTKLACTSAGHLLVKTSTNTNDASNVSGTTLAQNAAVTVGLNTDSTYVAIHLEVDTSDSGFLQDLYIEQSSNNSDYFVTKKLDGLQDWVNVGTTTRYFYYCMVENTTDYIRIKNYEAQSNKVKILINTGRN